MIRDLVMCTGYDDYDDETCPFIGHCARVASPGVIAKVYFSGPPFYDGACEFLIDTREVNNDDEN